MSDEIEQLRAAGRTDEAISALLRERVGVEVPADAISRYYAGPDLRRR